MKRPFESTKGDQTSLHGKDDPKFEVGVYTIFCLVVKNLRGFTPREQPYVVALALFGLLHVDFLKFTPKIRPKKTRKR